MISRKPGTSMLSPVCPFMAATPTSGPSFRTGSSGTGFTPQTSNGWFKYLGSSKFSVFSFLCINTPNCQRDGKPLHLYILCFVFCLPALKNMRSNTKATSTATKDGWNFHLNNAVCPCSISATSSEAETLCHTLAKCWRTFSCLCSRPPLIHSPIQS